jgi:methylaspartate mutase epsilon subunit
MPEKMGHTILLGGIGGDSHSVGLIILRQALIAEGYTVRYLGTQNRLEDFARYTAMTNAVLISSMDGHSRYYLSKLPELKRGYLNSKSIWYLGGNLHIGEGRDCERDFLEMGFDRVFVKFVDARAVLELLRNDLSSVEPMVAWPALWEQSQPSTRYLSGTTGDEVLESDMFARSRREVLCHWRTGSAAEDFDSNAAFLSRQPSFPDVQAIVNAGKLPILIQPRCGVSLVQHQIKLFRAFKSLNVRVASYQVDSLTRNNDYKGAEEIIREDASAKVSTLNGFPVINHGVAALRRIIREVGLPLQTRHSTRDPRLLAEISYAGGVTSFEGGPICYNIPYYKDYCLEESIRNWQYVDRLTGLYFERYGIALDREFFGTLTATLIAPSLAIAVDIIEAILAVRQGVKCVSLGYAEQGHRVQDIAAIRTMKAIAGEVLSNIGYKGVQINTVFHQYMAAFPSCRKRAAALIYSSAVTAALSGATRVIVKTPAEASNIPLLEDNVDGIRITMRGIADAVKTNNDELQIAEECRIIRREVEAILDGVIFCGNGDIAQGVVTGFEKGYLDIPFSPSIYNRGEVMTVRDVDGAVRYLSTGNLPFDKELRQFHVEKAAERRRAEGLCSRKYDYSLIEQDVLQITRGEYDKWPLYG